MKSEKNTKKEVELTTPAFRIKKNMMVGLAVWLNNQILEGRYSRVRSRFVTRLANAMNELETDRRAILDKYVEKEMNTETGEEQWVIKTLENGTQEFAVSPEKMVELNKEIDDLYQEDFVVDFSPETHDDLVRIKDIILDTTYKFGPEEHMSPEQKNDKIIEANNYQVWCDAVEKF